MVARGDGVLPGGSPPVGPETDCDCRELDLDISAAGQLDVDGPGRRTTTGLEGSQVEQHRELVGRALGRDEEGGGQIGHLDLAGVGDLDPNRDLFAGFEETGVDGDPEGQEL